MEEKVITVTNNVIEIAREHLRQTTGYYMTSHFSCVKSGPDTAAIFRRMSFIPADELSVIRLRMMPDVTPKIQSSVVNGFFVGEIKVDKQGRILRGLNAQESALLDYLIKEPMGAFTVEKLGPRTFKIHYPGDWVEVLIARAARMMKAAPRCAIRNHRWIVSVGSMRFDVERFLEACTVTASEERFLDLVKAPPRERARFRQLTRPCLLVAFGKTVDVSGALYPAIERQGQITDTVLVRLFAAYDPDPKLWIFDPYLASNGFLTVPSGAPVRPRFLAGKHVRVSPRWTLPEIHGAPVPAVEPPSHSPAGQRVRLPPDFVSAASKDYRAYETIVRRQYDYLLGCIRPIEVSGRFNGRRLSGHISSPDQAIYSPIWTPDHFFNALAMTDLDLTWARRLILGGFVGYMEQSGPRKGQIALQGLAPKPETAFPIWAPVVRHYFRRTGDRRLLEAVWPFLEMNNAYLDKHYLRDGVYVGARGFWNDYSTGPKTLPTVAGIGMNSLIALQKRIMAELGPEIGVDGDRLRRETEQLHDAVNTRFWDERAGFYFDYDHEKRALFATAGGERYFGLDNLLPLFAELVPQERIASIARHLTSSRYYGKYPAITTELSDDFMDERRLMVWVMTDWLVIQGLRNYGLHKIADGISRRVFNSFLKCWRQGGALPEALAGNLGLAPMENRSLAGVGCWAGFTLYLKEALREPQAVPSLIKE
ncbi:MAG: trehalase family glycosidase [Kiritimatiellae bacterium]|nr:trehalase family glycosidase [Kiritimatiellia bacterium]